SRPARLSRQGRRTEQAVDGASMSSHVARPPTPGAAPPPEPTFAERARTLVEHARAGVLSTLSRRRAGHPFGSAMPYALDESGRPLVLISALAMHTQNLQQDPRASLFVAESSGEDDPLAMGRVTLMGRADRVPSAEVAAVRPAYLARYPNASHWVDFGDFAVCGLEGPRVAWVGACGAM